MSRADFQVVDLFWVIFIAFALAPEAGSASRSAGADSCHEVKTAYMMRQIGPVELVPDRARADESLRVCVHSGPSCCSSKMEDNYMTAVRSETQQKMRSYSFELKYLITGHAKAYRETFESLVSFTSNLTSTLFDSAYSTLSSDCRPLVSQLFNDIKQHLSGDATVSLDKTVIRFYDDLFPLVYRRLLNPGFGPKSFHSSPSLHSNHDDCLRMTRQDVSPFGPYPRLLISGLSRALGVGHALSRLLKLAGEVVNATEKTALSRECGLSLVKMQYCSHCRGLTLIRPCTGLCVNVMRGCLVGVSELGGPWSSLVVLLQRLASTLATSSNQNSMELALLAIRNHVNDAILHAQLHGPHITSTVSTQTYINAIKISVHVDLHSEKQKGKYLDAVVVFKSLPIKGSKGDKRRSLKKLSREFEGSIQRYQWFFSELPEVLCESEMEVEQHTCWSGQDVVESYAGPVVGSSVKSQRENPEMTVRYSDPILKGAKHRLEQITQELVAELGWSMKPSVREEEPVEGSSPTGRAEGGSGDEECDDEDGCEGSGAQDGGESSSGLSPKTEHAAPPPRGVFPPHQPPPPQVAVRGGAHPLASRHLPLTLVAMAFVLLSPWESR
ncbi:hypothetical protein NQD34_002692 [Periophthalmus magnuspinnatus]|nr:hypothetical protein NQD34_002692 [Periophthalmus magnuspinnatus]